MLRSPCAVRSDAMKAEASESLGSHGCRFDGLTEGGGFSSDYTDPKILRAAFSPAMAPGARFDCQVVISSNQGRESGCTPFRHEATNCWS